MADLHTPYTLSDWINYLSHSEIDLLTELTQKLPPKPLIINIGAGVGTSALTFLSARPDSIVLTSEITYDANPYGGVENELGILQRAGFLDQGRYNFIVGDSIVTGKDYRGPKADLVFIDGDHEYESCLGDIQTWWPHLKEHGYVAIHDYEKLDAWTKKNPTVPIDQELIGHIIKPYPGVDRAVKESFLDGAIPVDEIKVVYTLFSARKL